MSFEAIELDINAVWGDRYEEEWQFVEGKEETPVDLSGLTPKVVIEGVGELTLGSGLERPSSNSFRVKLTQAQSEAKEKAHWYFELKEGSEPPETIFKGTWSFERK